MQVGCCAAKALQVCFHSIITKVDVLWQISKAANNLTIITDAKAVPRADAANLLQIHNQDNQDDHVVRTQQMFKIIFTNLTRHKYLL